MDSLLVRNYTRRHNDLLLSISPKGPCIREYAAMR